MKNEITEILKKYSEYYSLMKTQMDYIDELESKFSFIEGSLNNISDMYPEINLKNISRSDLRKIQQTVFRQTIVEPLLSSFNETKKNMLQNIWIGHLPINSINARCLYLPKTKLPIIIFYDKLFGILSFYAESKFISYQLKKIDCRLSNFFLTYITKVLVDVYKGKRNNIPCYKLPWSIKNSAVLIASVQESFLLAHEYAHIYLNHLEKVNSFNYVDGKIKLKEYSFQKKMEFEADLQAIKWIIDFKKNINDKGLLSLTEDTSMVLEIFTLFHIIEINCKINSTTHPTSEERLQFIYENIKGDLSEFESEFIEQMFHCIRLGFDIKDFEISSESEKILKSIIEHIDYDTVSVIKSK